MLFSSFSVEEGASQANKSELKQTDSPDFSLFRETFSSISCYCSTENAFVVTSVSRARTFLLSRSKGHHSAADNDAVGAQFGNSCNLLFDFWCS